MKDFRGKEITVGCTIAYPGRHSSTVYINVGVVVEIISDEELRVERLTKRWHRDRHTGLGEYVKGTRIVPFYSPYRCVIIERPDL